jgi:hypothetical protein
MSDDFYFKCSECGQDRAFKFRYLDKNNESVCTPCLHQRGGFPNVGRSATEEEGIKLGKKLMKKGTIPQKHIVVANPDPAVDLEIRLNKIWDERDEQPLFAYYVADIPLVPVPIGARPKRSQVVPVLVVERPKYGFFNLQWLDNALNMTPKIRVVNANFFYGKVGPRLEVFVEYVGKPPQYTIKPMRRR